MDTDDISAGNKNYEEEVVEFFVKEETTVVGWTLNETCVLLLSTG